MQDKPWRNEEFRNLEEGLPQLKEVSLQRAAKNFQGTTGVGLPRVSPGCSSRPLEGNVWRSGERWRNDKLKNVQRSDLEKAARNYKAKTRVGCDGIHPKVPLDSENETRGDVVELLEKVEPCGKWPQQAREAMFFS